MHNIQILKYQMTSPQKYNTDISSSNLIIWHLEIHDIKMKQRLEQNLLFTIFIYSIILLFLLVKHNCV